jgi:hypothetical protein
MTQATQAVREETKERNSRDGTEEEELEMPRDQRDGKVTELKGTQAASSKIPSGMTISPQTRPS